MNTHEVLVKGRNGMGRDGFDAWSYGDDDCGTPRCALGWVGWAAGHPHWRFEGDVDLQCMSGTSEAYAAALAALWETRPFTSARDVSSSISSLVSRKVECIALDLADRPDPDAQMFAWFDRAIQATAPLPADPLDGTLVAELEVVG